MKSFQIVIALLLVGFLVIEFQLFFRTHSNRRRALFRVLVWSSCLTGILFPNILVWMADLLNIDRAADLISYLFILIMIIVSLYFYSKQEQLNTQLTEVVRHLAIKEPRSPQSTKGSL